jgi:DNA helicase II / ATP-dependent DNA helicase PcrA
MLTSATPNFKEDLNPEQYNAVSAKPGPALVLAGAGSGKTRTLTYRVAYLLSKKIPPNQILLLTFTNKAAREMLTRVENLTQIPQYKFWGGTFHSIGQKNLRIYGDAIGLQPNYSILDEKDSQALLKEIINDKDKTFLKDKNNPKTKVITNIISLARNKQVPINEIIQKSYPFFDHLIEPIERFYQDYQERKLKQQVADYDDLLVYWLKLLKEKPEIAKKSQEYYKHILVDEYQDINKLQAQIVDTIGSHHNIMAVGDEAQCIYTWRGADYESIISFPQRHPGTTVYKIEINYRSTPEILSLANSVMVSFKGFYKKLQAVRPARVKPYVISTIDARQQAQFIIKRLQRLLQKGYKHSDIAILYRAHYQALDLQMELDRNTIPFIITSGIRFFEQAHVRDIIAQIRFVCNTQDTSAFIRFSSLLPRIGEGTASKLYKKITTSAIQNKTSILDAMLEDKVIPTGAASEEWKELVQTLQEINQAVCNETPHKAVQKAVQGWYSSFIRNIYPNWETRLDDLESLIGFASRFENMTDLLAQLVLLNSETSDRSIETDRDALRLTTIHQAKGLEFPIVFIIGLSEGLFPLKRAIEEDNIQEENRLFYVGITRAKDELYLSHPILNAQRNTAIPLSPSRFIQNLPKEHYHLLKWESPNQNW